MAIVNKLKLRREHKAATVELATLNREMALRMITLANETGEITPLIEAVEAMRTAEGLYSPDTAQIEDARVQKKLGDVLLNIGKNEEDMSAVEAAISAYRGVITIASMLGAQKLRTDTRKSYVLAMNYAGRGQQPRGVSLMGAA